MKEILPGILLLITAWTDIKSKEISLIVLGIFAMLGIFCMSITHNVNVIGLIGNIGIGLVIIVLSLLSEGAIGMGDGLLIIVMGLYLNLYKNLELLMVGILLSAFYSLGSFTIHKNLKKTIPLVPFLLLSYIFMQIFDGGVV